MVRTLQRIWLILAVAIVIIVLDQWTKGLVRQYIPPHSAIAPIPALDAFLVLEHVGNEGAAFGILQGFRWFFVLIGVVVPVAILIYAVRSLAPGDTAARLLLGLVAGGALGNFVDRLTMGFVTDFVRMGIPGLYYIPNFNVADSAIVCGTVGLAILFLWQDLHRERLESEEQTETAVTKS